MAVNKPQLGDVHLGKTYNPTEINHRQYTQKQAVERGAIVGHKMTPHLPLGGANVVGRQRHFGGGGLLLKCSSKNQPRTCMYVCMYVRLCTRLSPLHCM